MPEATLYHLISDPVRGGTRISSGYLAPLAASIHAHFFLGGRIIRQSAALINRGGSYQQTS